MAKPSHILIIRLSALGDVAMSVPVVRVLAKTYPELKITVLSRPFYKPLFDGIPKIEFLEADVYGKHKGFGILKLAKKAKANGIDAVADIHNVIRSKIVTKTLSLKGMKTASIDKGRTEKKALTASENKKFVQLKTTHQRYADVFEKLGLPIKLENHIFPNPKILAPKLRGILGVEPKKLIGIAPFAAYNSKMYPLELMTEVIETLDASNKYRIFLFGGGKSEIEKIKKLSQPFSNVANIAGKFSFEEELALMSNLDLMLAMDSGNGHLAAMYGVPVVTLWGVSHPFAGFVPFNQPEKNQILADRNKYRLIPTSIYGNKFPKGYEDAMTSIEPEEVVTKIKEILH